MVGNGFRPIFAGRLKHKRTGTTLSASYGAPWYLRLFLMLWYSVLTLVIAIGLTVGFENPEGEGTAWLSWLILPLFFLIPIAAHLIFNRNANVHYEAMLDHLGNVADLRVHKGQSEGF